MTNLVALCLLVSTFLAAEVWTPSPAMTHVADPDADVIVKDGHRVVVVEYDREGKSNTKIKISPPERKPYGVEEEGVFESVKEKAKEAASHLPNIGEGISRPETSTEEGEELRERHATPGELICDAFGKCRHKIASTLGKVKDRVSRVPEEAHGLGETATEAAARTVHGAEEKVGRMAQDVKEAMGHKAHGLQDKAKEKLTEKAEHTEKVVGQMAQEAKGTAETAWGRVKTAVAETLSPMKVGSVVGLTGLATAYGTCVWVTFVSSYVLAGVLGRHQFGLVQSKVYPVYFKAVSVGILVGLLGHVLSRNRRLLTETGDMWQALNLFASLLMVEGNASFLEPRATKAMFERIKVEKEEGKGREGTAAAAEESRDQEELRQRLRKLSERLQMLNTYSSWLNILTLLSLTWHLVYLAHRLSVTC